MVFDRFFTQEQQLSFLKDEAIFSDTLHQRKRAILQLVGNCHDTKIVSAILDEIIDSCLEMSDAEFRQFCLTMKAELEEKE